MKVKLLRNLGQTDAAKYNVTLPEPDDDGNVASLEGEIVDVSDEDAEALMSIGLAKETDDAEHAPHAEDLKAKTLDELHTIARDETVNLKGKTDKKSIVKAIAKARAAKVK